MKFPIPIRCQCGNEWTIFAVGNETPESTHCDKCGLTVHLINSAFVSTKVFVKAQRETQDGDFSLGIILSAMSVECELARLFFKWKEIDGGYVPADVTPAIINRFEAEFRKLLRIEDKLDAVSKLLTYKTLAQFFKANDAMQNWIKTEQPVLVKQSLKTYMQENLFWKRNRVIHSGKVDFKKEDSTKALAVATVLLRLLQAMDVERIKELDESHRKQRKLEENKALHGTGKARRKTGRPKRR